MKKIMFNDRLLLTDAVLNGEKTMTRRTCKDKATNELILAKDVYSWRYYPEQNIVEFLMNDRSIKVSVLPYKVGEVVAVAQSYKSVFEESLNYALPRYHWLDDHIDEKGFENKMFVKASEMPHQIQITDVKIERLQDISDEDCLKEGVLRREIRPFRTIEIKYQVPSTVIYKDNLKDAFAVLIDKVSGKGTWESNPWVFAYSFKLIK